MDTVHGKNRLKISLLTKKKLLISNQDSFIQENNKVQAHREYKKYLTVFLNRNYIKEKPEIDMLKKKITNRW